MATRPPRERRRAVPRREGPLGGQRSTRSDRRGGHLSRLFRGVYIVWIALRYVAQHPSASGFANLLELKEKELQALVKQHGLEVPLKGNPGMRKALWECADDLGLTTTAIDVSKAKEDGKRVWEQLEGHLPMFALFQSDRASRETDGEIQNPLKGAIATAIAEAKAQIEEI